MVMHASKHPRLHDGYYDRQRAHPYQAVGKYPSKSQSGNCEANERKDSPSVRQTDTPSNRHSSNSASPRTAHQGKLLPHVQRTKERQRGSSGSPSENSVTHQSATNSNSSDRYTNHDRNLNETLEKLNKACKEWSEHISSSNKKYFYNCRTEVSQWEKPKEWAQRELLLKELQKLKEKRESGSIRSKEKLVSRETPPSSSVSSSTSSEQKHSSDHSRPIIQQSSGRQHDRQHSSSSSSSSSSQTQQKSMSSALSRSSVSESPQHKNSYGRYDMVRSSSMDTSKTIHRHNMESPLEREMSSPTTPQSTSSRHSQPLRSPLVQKHLSKSPVVVNSSNQQGPRNEELSHNGQSFQQRLNQVEKCLTNVLAANQTSPMSLASISSDVSSPQFSPHTSTTHLSTPTVNSVKTKHPVHDEGSPTSPAHSNKSSCLESPVHSVSSTTSGVPHSNPPATPSVPPTVALSPSLIQYYNEELITHVSGWPSEMIERQAQRVSEDSHQLGSLTGSQISVDLKFARSLVRVSEIQATLQEQRILFLQQQIRELEKLKNESNAGT
ncbi:WW domain-containing adapter protein with coiled-coil-like isoform X2 [Glandiceps talaboti]